MMLVQERISFGGRSVTGFGIGALGTTVASRLLTYKAGDTWELDFYADQPVSSQQFLSLVEEFQSEPVEIISFAPITEKHFRAIVKWREAGQASNMSDKEWEGIRYTVTAAPYIEPAPPTFTVQVDFSSDQPVTPQQFFAFVSEVQAELISAESTVSIMPLTESTFRGVFKVPQSFLGPGDTITDVIPVGDTAIIQGVTFTITSASFVPAPTHTREPNPCIPGTGVFDPSTGKCVPCPVPSMFDMRTGICTPVPAAPPALVPTPAPDLVEEEKKGLSTAAVGIGVVVVAVGGGAVYAATRKKKPRRRAA